MLKTIGDSLQSFSITSVGGKYFLGKYPNLSINFGGLMAASIGYYLRYQLI